MGVPQVELTTVPFGDEERMGRISAFELARGYTESDMTAYVQLQQAEFGMEGDGYTATRHQREVGAGYFDDVATVISGGTASTLALEGSTEEEQF